MRYEKTLAGCIDIWSDSSEYPDNTVAFAEHQANDPDRVKINWKDEVLDLTWCYRNTPNAIMHKIYEDFHDTVTDATKQYMDRYGIGENCYNESHYHMLRYRAGEGEYPLHYDGSTASGRHISVIQYLNEDFEGGELVFPLHHIIIKPRKGLLVCFPATSHTNT